MKKNLWVLLALTALIAMFVIAGCAPKPTPTPTPTPTATPVVPVDYCPTTFTTVITSLYCGNWTGSNNPDQEPTFNVLIQADKAISLVDDAVGNWSVKVKRYVPFTLLPGGVAQVYEKELTATVLKVSQLGAKSIQIKATVMEPYAVGIGDLFYGLICGQGCYDTYIWAINGYPPFPIPWVIAGKSTSAYADKVVWTYIGANIAFVDEMGNICPECDLSGEACCEPVCTTCVTPNCPIEGCQ